MYQKPEPRWRRDVVGLSLNEVPVVYAGQQFNDASVQWPGQAPGRSGLRFSRVRSLLVALDGSPASEHALPYALAIARRSGATIRLVHVHSLLDSVSVWQQYYSDKLQERLRRKKQAYLQSTLRRISRRVDVQITAVVIKSGEIARSLREAAAGAALVVMATRGRGFVGRLLHGSVADTLMRTSPCPLLLVRGHRSAVDLASDPLPRHVLVPLDGTCFAEKAIECAAAMDWLSCAQFTLAHFQNLDMIGSPELADPRRYLLDAAARWRERPRVVNSEVVTSDQRTATAILSFAEEQEVDLIALTTRGRNGLSRLVNWSVTDSVVRRATSPVLVLRASDQESDRHKTRRRWRSA
jgi:nucleotide-binding universal stress UspA family protein